MYIETGKTIEKVVSTCRETFKSVEKDVSKNTAPTNLVCYGNRLTAEGLNALFGTLHANASSKTIYVDNNPGTGDCDRSIAEAEGRTVD